MSLQAWRLVKARYAAEAFSGEGARLYGGRWNSQGIPMVYTAEHASLSVLEILVHLQRSAILGSYVLIPVSFDDQLVEVIEAADLPRNWRATPAPASLQQLGDRWVESGRAPVLKVPSAVLPIEWNYLLNPQHPDFGALVVGRPMHHLLDPRLAGMKKG